MRHKKFWFNIVGTLAVLAMALMLPRGAGAASKYKVLYRFKGSPDGAAPAAGLVFDAAGNLYGTTVAGGSRRGQCGNPGCGVVFELRPKSDGSWAESVLHRFLLSDGDGHSASRLIFDAAGNLYGTTEFDSAFELSPNQDGSWTERVLHEFGGVGDGAFPLAGLIFDGSGNLYSTTGQGGVGYVGVVFKLTPNSDGSWTESVLHSFTGADGASPEAGLVFDAAGNIYGTTESGGAAERGVVFKLTRQSDGTWVESVLYSFTGGADGGLPAAEVIFDPAGNLYGTTVAGGITNFGLVFKLTPRADGSWKESMLHTFKNQRAWFPSSGLVFDTAGNLYGTTENGGYPNSGAVFKLTPQPDGSWAYRVLHFFRGKPAFDPRGSLVLDKSGNLYGTASQCGSGEGCNGVVFEITP
jgi:uncharacterized repeat protein (TIGR03803 family)